MFSRYDQPYDKFKDERKAEKILNWVKNQVSPPIEEIQSEKELEEAMEKDDYVLIGHFNQETESKILFEKM